MGASRKSSSKRCSASSAQHPPGWGKRYGPRNQRQEPLRPPEARRAEEAERRRLEKERSERGRSLLELGQLAVASQDRALAEISSVWYCKGCDRCKAEAGCFPSAHFTRTLPYGGALQIVQPAHITVTLP